MNNKGTDQTAQISRLDGWCINSFVVKILQNQVFSRQPRYHAAAYLDLHRAAYADRSMQHNNSLHAGFCFMLSLWSADFFSKLLFQKNSFWNAIRVCVSNGLGPDQEWPSVGPDLGPNWLQRFISADDRNHCKQSIATDWKQLLRSTSSPLSSQFYPQTPPPHTHTPA